MRAQEFTGPERRAATRYPISFPLRYRILSKSKLSGSGTSVNMSSSGILVAAGAERAPLVGASVEIFVDWPAALSQSTVLELKLVGRVVRSVASGFAASVARTTFEKRTRPSGQ